MTGGGGANVQSCSSVAVAASRRPGSVLALTRDTVSAADDRAPTLEQDDVAPSAAGILSHAVLDADASKPDGFMQGEARRVLEHDAGEERPVAGGLGGGDQRLEEGATDARRRASDATYTLSHATPAYTLRAE